MISDTDDLKKCNSTKLSFKNLMQKQNFLYFEWIIKNIKGPKNDIEWSSIFTFTDSLLKNTENVFFYFSIQGAFLEIFTDLIFLLHPVYTFYVSEYLENLSYKYFFIASMNILLAFS